MDIGFTFFLWLHEMSILVYIVRLDHFLWKYLLVLYSFIYVQCLELTFEDAWVEFLIFLLFHMEPILTYYFESMNKTCLFQKIFYKF